VVNNDTTGHIMADGMVVCNTATVLEGVSCWFSMYPIFNIAYPKNMRLTLIFIQKLFLEINDEVKTPLRVLNKMSEISRN